MVITEYDLPRKQIQPHDVVVDSDGIIWFSHFGEQFLGKMDPKTGQVWEYPIPLIKAGFPIGTLDLKTDKAGNLWVGMMYQGGVARFDKKTETFKVWPIPKEWQTDAAQSGHLDPSATHIDGKVWVKNSDRSQILRLDPETGQWENLGSFSDPANGKRLGVYGIPADRDNNLYLLDFSSSNVGRIDAKTGQFTIYSGALPNSRPRRGAVDEHNRLWFAEYAGNAIGMLDPKTGKVQEWVLPTPWGTALRRGHRQERRGVDGLDDERSRVAARSQDRRLRRVSAAEDHQYPPRVRGQFDQPGHLLDGQQPRRLDRQGRTAGLRRSRATSALGWARRDRLS